MVDKSIQLKYGDNYQGYLVDHYPEIHELWCDAVNADFDSEFLYEEGKLREAEEKNREHEVLWDEYLIASKLVLYDFFDE